MRVRAVPFLLLAGCSLRFTTGPHAPPGRQTCSESYVAPLADTLGAVGGAAVVATGIGYLAGVDNASAAAVPVILGAVAGSLVYAASAGVGYRRVHACNVAAAPPPRPEPTLEPDAPLVEAVAARDPAAAQLTREAHGAALRHQCGVATSVQARVRDLDAEYHAKVFVVDPAIARCLE